MSQNEVDEIAAVPGTVFRQAMNAARSWLARQHHSIRGAKLTRQKRDEMARHIEKQLGAERIAAAWMEKRVGDYQHEARIVAAMRGAPNLYSPGQVQAASARLAAVRTRIESTLHMSGMSLEQRGQAALALGAVDQDPASTLGPVFPPLSNEDAMFARAAGVQSELQDYTRREEEQQNREYALWQAEQDRAAQARADRHTATPSPATANRQFQFQDFAPGREPRGIDQASPALSRADAIQKIRHVEHQWQRDYTKNGSGRQYQQAREDAVRDAEKAGLSAERIQWEFNNAEANSRCRVEIASSSPDGSSQTNVGYFPSEAEGAKWVHSTVIENNWKAGTQFTVRAREAGQRTPFYLREGNQTTVGRATEKWRDVTAAHAKGEPYRKPDPAEQGSQQAREATADSTERPPQPGRVSGETAGGLGQRTATAQAAPDMNDMVGRVRELADQRNTLAEQTKALTGIVEQQKAELEQQKAELERLRGERDEAVAKLVERTKPSERYGSAQRQAKTAKKATGRSALAGHQPGSALSNGSEQDTERDGAER
ncbi:hypothetical protein AB0L82_26155 [Nocardia sp. NPDC052001]|uniref:hypothetical protein n=1 Tax=Nocardia sp. NPDC052001 TaxID=3154853 RepID=UPI00341323E8